MWLGFFKKCMASLNFLRINLLSLSMTFFWSQLKLWSVSQQFLAISFLSQHSWNPPLSPLYKREGVGPFKNWVTLGGRGTKIFARKGGYKPERGVTNFLLLTVQFNRIYIFGSSVSHARFLSLFSSKSCTKTWYHL